MGNGLRNIGLVDALIRLIVGFVFIFFGVRYNSWVYYSFAILLITTAIVGFCPFYVLIGVNTNRRQKVARISKDDIKKAVEGKIEVKKASKRKNKVKEENKTNKTKASKVTTSNKTSSRKTEKKKSKKKSTKKTQGNKKSSTKKTKKSEKKSKKK